MTLSEKRRDLIQKFAALGSLSVLITVFALTSRAFFTPTNALTVGLQVCTIAYLGMGMTVVIITGGIDLSVGSVLALGGVIAAMLVKAGTPIWLGMAMGLLLGCLAGLLNGLFVAQLKLPPFIATLGMMGVARGVILQATGGRAIAGMGEAFGVLGNGALFKVASIGADGYPDIKFVGIPYPVIVMVVLAIVMSVVLSRTRFGRHVYATGSNNEAARLSGVNVYRTTVSAYVISGFFAGLTGIVLMSRLVTGQPNEGISYELDAIAAAVIGGASLTCGGIGTISGTIIGAFVIGILRNGLNMNGVSSFVQQIIIGVVILLTVWIDQLRSKRSTRVRVFTKQKQVEEPGAPAAASSGPARRAVE
jgi:ribose transport system permease protein